METNIVLWEGSKASVWDADRLRAAANAGGICLWSWNVDTDHIAMDQSAHALWGVPRTQVDVTFEDLSARVHPQDLGRVRSAFAATRRAPGSYELDFRILHGKEIRWIAARGLGADEGDVDRLVFGIFLDVTKARAAEEARGRLAEEMSHRVKNVFAVASALTSISAHSTSTTAEMARDLTQRFRAMGRAHDLVRPPPDETQAKSAKLFDLLDAILAPYIIDETEGRIKLTLPEVPVGETSATTLALIVHELATNSVKYGALSTNDGTLHISCTTPADEVVLVWTELGGPPVAPREGSGGFGTRLITQSIAGQLGGSAVFDWLATGLCMTLRLNRARLAS